MVDDATFQTEPEYEPGAVAYVCDPDPETKVDARRLPGLVRQAVSLVWAAGRREFFASTVLQVIGGVGIALQLLLGQRALTALLSVQTGGSLATVLPWAAGIALVAAGLLFASAAQREHQQLLGELVGRHVQGRVLDVATAVELTAFETPSFHNRLQRIRNNAHQPLNMVFGLSGLIGAVVGVIGVMVALVAIEPLLILLVLVVLIPAWLVSSRRSEAFFRLFWKLTPRDRERFYLGGLLSSREAAGEVRAFGLAPSLRGRYEDLYDERIEELRTVARRQLKYSLAANVGIGLSLGATLVLVAWLALSGRVPLADAGIAVAGVAVVGARLSGAGYAAGALSEAALYIEDYQAFLEIVVGEPMERPSAPAPGGFERITVDEVTFTYPTGERPALHGVSLHVDAGEVVALVGENGSGKTTLAKLLAGLYRPAAGSIHWDGADVSVVDPEELRQSVAVIFQDFIHFHLSARDNVGLGKPDRADDLDAVRRAAVQAGAEGFLEALPGGYDTQLGPEFEGGTDLSQGQWQRVALARAFFRDAPFVILDEPTAALDPRAESDLFRRIRTLLAGRTVLLISHRFSSVRSADRIYVLDKGTVTEGGTHDELMARGGQYAELFTLQAAAYLEPAPAGNGEPGTPPSPGPDHIAAPAWGPAADKDWIVRSR